MPLLDQIDKNPKDNHIDIQELQDAIKPEGFLTKEENIKGVSVELNTSEKEPIAKTLEHNLNQEINNILTQTTLNDNDIKIVDLWNKLLGNRTEYANTKQSLDKKLTTLVTDITHNVDKLIAANTTPNKEHYTATDIKHIQLRANLHFGADVTIDGKRGSSINLSQNMPNAQLTNLYVYRLELANRKDIVDIRKSLKSNQVFEHILQTPNVEAALNALPDQQAQNKVLLQFLDFYLKEIKQAGLFFEDKIGGGVLSVLFVYMINAEKYKDDQAQSKFYTDQITKTKKEIKEFNQNNINANNFAAINDRLQTLDKLGADDKIQKIKIYKELLDLCDKVQNQDLKNSLLINISTTFSESEIKQSFGDIVMANISKTRDTIGEDLKKHEKTNDILSQIENIKIGKRAVSRASWDQYAKTWPHDANANKSGLTGTIQDYSAGGWEGKYDSKTYPSYTERQNIHVPGDIYVLQIPGGEPVVVRIPNDRIQDLILLGNSLEENTYLVMPDYTKEFTIQKGGNTGGDYSYKTMDHDEKNKNVLYITDLALAKKQNNGDITLHKMIVTTKMSYSTTPYETITVDQQHKASLTSNLALRSTYTPEAVQSFNDLGDIQTTMGNIQALYDKMGTATIDWKNTNVFGAIFAMSSPLTAPLLNTYVPVEGGLSSTDEKNIYTRATQMGDKVADLRLQQKKLENIRNQIQKMEKNIDKSKIITADERKIIQALDAVNFLINGMQQGGAFDEFISYMTNPKYVGANGTFTDLGMEWIKNNGLKIVCAIGMAVAVIAAIPTGGASLLTIAAIGTLGGMAGSRLGQWANEGLQNSMFKREVIINGKTREIVYNDPTDIKLLSEGKLSPQDFAMSVGREFAVGTVSMYGFMKAGQIIGKSIGNFVDKNPSSPLSSIVKKVKPSFGGGANDPYTRNIFESVANKGSQGGFFSKFTKEFGQEIGEEGTEGVANTISEKSGIPGLAMLVTMWNSLTPGVNSKIYENNNVSVASIDRVGDNSILELHYDGNSNDLIQHFQKNGFTLNSDGTLSKQNEVVPSITDVVRLTPSLASVDVRNMDALFSTYGMQIDHTQGNRVSFPSDIDPIKLTEFQNKFEQNGMGTVVINPDGSFDIRTMDKTIQFVPTLSNTLSPAIDMQVMQDIKNKVDSHYATKKAILENKINTETNNKHKDKLKEDLKDLEKAYEKFNKILDGSITMNSYVGIRNIAKPLGLDIETEQLPLLKKLVENSIKAKNGNKEVTQKDVAEFMNSELTIDKTIENTFGTAYAKPETFKGGDALMQITDILSKWPHESSELLSAGDIQTLKTFATDHIQALKDGMQLSEAQIFDLTQTNIRKLIFQNIADKGLLSGSDHGILHIIQGDVFTARNILDQTTGLDAKTKASIKAMVGQMIVDHDIGYNMQSFEKMITEKSGSLDYDKSTFFDATKDHPIFSRLFVEANADYYIKIFGQANFDAMKVAMLDHSDIHSTDFGSSINQINNGDTKGISTLLQQLIAAPDCMGVTHMDKLHKLFQHPNMLLLLGKFEFINLNFPANDPIGIKLNQENKAQMIREITRMEKEGTIDSKTAQYYRNAVDKGMDTESSKTSNPNGFGLKFNFSSYIYSTEGFTVNPDNNGGKIHMKLDLSMFQTVTGLYGEDVALNNVSKVLGDYGTVVSINGESVANDIDYKNFAKDNFGLANRVQQSNLGDVLSIQVQQASGSIVTFEILVTEIPGESAVLERRLDNIATYNRDVNKSIQNILSEVQKNPVDKITIDQNIAAIITIDASLGKAIDQIINGQDVATQVDQIQKLWAEHISQGYDNAIETNEKSQVENMVHDTDTGIDQISTEIESNKDNPKKLIEIMHKLIDRSKSAVHDLHEGAKEKVPGYKKTAHYLHAVSEFTIIHHGIHQLSAIFKDVGIMGKSAIKGEMYTLTGAAIDLLANIAGLYVTGIHAAHVLHGQFASGINMSSSLTTVLDQISEIGKHSKEHFALKQTQKNTYNELISRADQRTVDNKSDLVANYMRDIKILCRFNGLELDPNFTKEFGTLYPGITFEHVEDAFNHILHQIETNQGDMDSHVANIHTLLPHIYVELNTYGDILQLTSDVYTRTMVARNAPPGDPHSHVGETLNPRGHTFGH